MAKTILAANDDLLAAWLNSLNSGVPTGDNADGSFPLLFATSGGSGTAYTISLTFGPDALQFPAAYNAGLMVIFKAHADNTGSATVNINSIGAKDIRLPGGAKLRAGDIKQDDYVILLYDSNNDYFLYINANKKITKNGISTSLIIQNNSSNPTYQVDLDADDIVLEDSAGNQYRAENVNLTADISAGTGANKLDVGSEATSTWYYLWPIYNPTTDTLALLLSASPTAPTMPSGYTYKALAGAIYNDSGGDFISIVQTDNRVVMAPIEVLTNGTQGSYTVVDLSPAIPVTAKTVRGWIDIAVPTISDGNPSLAANSNGFGESNFAGHNASVGTQSFIWSFRINNLVETQAFYYRTSDALDIDITGWEY